MSKWTPYLGHSQLLSQKDLDQGDTTQRIGTYVTLTYLSGGDQYYREGEWLVDGFKRDLNILRSSPGRYRRSSDPKQAGHDPRRLSRDQKSILMLAMAALCLRSELLAAFTDQLKRLGFHQNIKQWESQDFNFPDLMHPQEIAVLIRGMNWWLLYPVLCILDLTFVLDLYFRKNGLWDIDNMLCQQLMFANWRMKTPLGLIAWHFYKKTDFKSRIKHYHTYTNGIEPLWELYDETIWRRS